MKRLFVRFDDNLLACQAPLYRYARSLTRDPTLAEELVQDTYERALGAEHKPDPPTEEATRAWLFTIVRNLWHNEVRHRNRWGLNSTLEEAAPDLEAADVQVHRKLLHYEVRSAIDALPEPHREIILLRDIEGMSYAEIARLLECPPGTVMSRLARARDGLRRLLSVPTARPAGAAR